MFNKIRKEFNILTKTERAVVIMILISIFILLLKSAIFFNDFIEIYSKIFNI